MFLFCLIPQGNRNEDVWLLDNGCSNHTISNNDIFHFFMKKIKTWIKLGDDHLLNALGKTIITFVTKNNEKDSMMSIMNKV